MRARQTVLVFLTELLLPRSFSRAKICLNVLTDEFQKKWETLTE